MFHQQNVEERTKRKDVTKQDLKFPLVASVSVQ